jgi:hypothetical protein
MRILALIFVFVLALGAHGQARTDRERDNLLGPVKSIRLQSVALECLSGTLAPGEPTTSSEDYDPSGRVIGNRNRFLIDDPISRMLSYPFDESLPRIVKPTYWENGAPTGWKYGNLIYTDVYTFDNQGRRAEWRNYGPDGAPGIRSIVIFDKHGRLEETKSYNATGALASWNVITRDDRGNVLESAFRKEDGALVEVQSCDRPYLERFVSTYEFDSVGNWIRRVMSKPVLKDGVPILEPYVFHARTVTYH